MKVGLLVYTFDRTDNSTIKAGDIISSVLPHGEGCFHPRQSIIWIDNIPVDTADEQYQLARLGVLKERYWTYPDGKLEPDAVRNRAWRVVVEGLTTEQRSLLENGDPGLNGSKELTLQWSDAMTDELIVRKHVLNVDEPETDQLIPFTEDDL